MIGLFDRDYKELTAEEMQEKEKIDAECGNVTKAKFGKRNLFHKYPKAIRHYMSLFPNNYMDIVLLKETEELTKQCNDFEALLEDKEITELDIKRYIQDNAYYHIPAAIFERFDFGHHEAVLFKEFPLGTSYRADYLLAGRASSGWQFIFVEFENPYGSVTMQDGSWGRVVRNGLNQIEDWKNFLEANYSTVHAEFMRYTNKSLPVEFTQYDSTRMHYVVVAGRREDFKNPRTREKQRRTEQESKIKVLHYENLLDSARLLIGRESY